VLSLERILVLAVEKNPWKEKLTYFGGWLIQSSKQRLPTTPDKYESTMHHLWIARDIVKYGYPVQAQFHGHRLAWSVRLVAPSLIWEGANRFVLVEHL
jgi:hypothetical protein